MAKEKGKFERGLLSFPKCGRTWVRLFLDYYNLYAENEIMVLFDHRDEHDVDKRALLVRHPCDVMVSLFIHRKMRKKGTSDFDRFLRGKAGVGWLNESYLGWNERSSYQIVFRYEDLFSLVTWRALFGFWGISVNEDAFMKAFESTKFENVRKNLAEIQGFPSSWRYMAAQHGRFNVLEPDHNDYHKFRRGVIGGYVDYMTEEQIEYVLDGFTFGKGLEHLADDYRKREKYERGT